MHQLRVNGVGWGVWGSLKHGKASTRLERSFLYKWRHPWPSCLSDPYPAAIYHLTPFAGPTRARVFRCILQATPAASSGPDLSADKSYPAVQPFDVVRWYLHQADPVSAVMWLGTIRIPPPPLLRLLSPDRCASFSASPGWHLPRRPRRHLSPQ